MLTSCSKNALGILIAILVFPISTLAADAPSTFSNSLSPEEYQSAGLAKLSPEERARLDALIEARLKTDAGTAIAVSEPESAPAKGSGKSAAKPKKVKIDPGTDIEYNTVELELEGTFAGFEKGTVFTLSNGQRWRVVSGSYSCGPDPKVRKVTLKPGMLGSFFLEFEKIRTKAKVELLK